MGILKNQSQDTPKRIFIKGLNWVGDALISTPAIAHLRETHPESRITLMARPWVAAVYEHNPHIDELWVHDESASQGAFLKGAKMVREGRFEVGIALPNSWRSALLLKLGDVKWRVGYAIGARGLLLNGGVDLPQEVLELHQVYYYLKLIEPMCGKPEVVARMALQPGEVERREIELMLARLGLDRGKPIVGVAPGSINSEAKRWPAERFAELADRLAGEYGAEIVLLGSGSEREVVGRVAAAMKQPAHNLAGEMTLGQVIPLIERLTALVCNDSGAMHLGAALGIPTVAIFGPTDWTTTYPFHPRAKVVRAEGIDCAPCMLRDCPIDHRCMTRVSVDQALESLKTLMREIRKRESIKVRP